MTEETSFYKSHIFCCTNERPAGHPRGCCREKGGDRLQKYMKARVKELGIDSVRVNASGCLDRCELGPVFVVYPEGVWYTASTPADIDEIITSHLMNGKPVDRLRLANDQAELRDDQKPA